MATTCQAYPLNPGDADLADVAEPHAARASDISKVDAPTSERNLARCRMGHPTPCRRKNPFITFRRCGPSPGSTIPYPIHYPARIVGGEWLCRTCPFGPYAVVVPSGWRVSCQPQRWMQTSWWNWHNRTQSLALVLPP